MRIITGTPLSFFDSIAGMQVETAPPPLLPTPPPVYSLINTTCCGVMPHQRATLGSVCATLCVDAWMYSLPFCQAAHRRLKSTSAFTGATAVKPAGADGRSVTFDISDPPEWALVRAEGQVAAGLRKAE